MTTSKRDQVGLYSLWFSSGWDMITTTRDLRDRIQTDSNSEVLLRADSIDGDTLQEQGVHIVAGRNSLQVALTQAVLLIRGETGWGALNVIHTLTEADGKRADLELSIEASLIFVQILLFVFVEELILEVKQFAP